MITITDLTKTYSTHAGPRVVLDKVNLQVKKGQKIGILGRNGSGKSTLVRMISGAEYPTSGKVVRTMSVSWPLAFHGGFQGSLSGLDNLRFICRVYNTPFEPIVPFVKDFSELGRYLREPVKTYSSGMLARLAFALSLAVEFDCFLIDEVVAVGDQRFHERCHQELFIKRGERAMIIISHNPHYIRAHCQSAAVLLRGHLHEFSDVDQAFKFYQEHAAEQDT